MSGIVNKAKDALHKDHSTSTSHTHGTTTGHSTSTNAGPHDSNFANKADPRIESDLDASHNMGAAHGTGQIGTESTNTHSGPHVGSHTGTHTGMMGGISQSTNAGPHDSNLANLVDPRVDSDLDGRGNRYGAATGGPIGVSGSHATPGSGTAQNTAGPHNSDTLNRIDPRVDSDVDGSKTYAGNKTHA